MKLFNPMEKEIRNFENLIPNSIGMNDGRIKTAKLKNMTPVERSKENQEMEDIKWIKEITCKD